MKRNTRLHNKSRACLSVLSLTLGLVGYSQPAFAEEGATTDIGTLDEETAHFTLATLAGASTAKCKPLDGVNVWTTIAEGKPSPRTEVIYNVEPIRGSVRQGDWKLILRTLIPTSVDLYNLAKAPLEKNNDAVAHPDKVAAMQDRLNALGKETAKPNMASEGDKSPAATDVHDPSMNDLGMNSLAF